MSQIRDRSRDNPRGTGHSSARGEVPRDGNRRSSRCFQERIRGNPLCTGLREKGRQQRQWREDPFRKKRSAFFTLRNSPRDARVIRTRKRIFLILRFFFLFIKKKTPFSPKPRVLNENGLPARNYERSFSDILYSENRSSRPSKVPVRICLNGLAGTVALNT